VEGLDGAIADLVNNGIALAFGRLALAAGLLAGDAIADIAARLHKTEQTLYKTAHAADLYALSGFLKAVEAILDERLGRPSVESATTHPGGLR